MRSVRGHFDRLSDEQYGQLLSVVLNEDDPESTSSLATVVVGWAQHVRRLHDELDDLSDRDTLWREYDFYAALDIRSRVRTLLIKSPSSARALVRPLVEASDAEFVSFTVVDDRDLVTELGLPARRPAMVVATCPAARTPARRPRGRGSAG